MQSINPYLNFNGNTEEAFNFYREVFGGEFKSFQRFRDAGGCEEVPETEGNKIMHVALPIGKQTVLMGTDAIESMGQKLTFGDNMSLAIATDSEEETISLCNKIAEGGMVIMKPEKMGWGGFFGMAKDKFGVQWLFNFENNLQD